MPSPMILVILFAVVGVWLLISGGIIVGSIKKLTAGDSTANKNIENVGLIINILPGIAAFLVAAYFMYKARQPGIDNNISPLFGTILALAFGICLIISGAIITASINKVSGDTTAQTNIKRVGLWMNLVPGVLMVLGAGAFFMYSRRNTSSIPF